MKRRLRGSMIVEATIVVPLVIVVALVMIILIVKEFQTSVNTMKLETSMYLGGSMRDVMTEWCDTPRYFKCDTEYYGALWSEESTVVNIRWKQASEYFKIYDIDPENMTMVGFDNRTAYDWLVTLECMRVINGR